jgi:hypothetical protein
MRSVLLGVEPWLPSSRDGTSINKQCELLMNVPDFRALCAELLAEVEYLNKILEQDAQADLTLLPRARAALSQPAPKPPTDEEFYQFWESHPELGVTCDEPVKMLRAGYNWGQGNE